MSEGVEDRPDRQTRPTPWSIVNQQGMLQAQRKMMKERSKHYRWIDHVDHSLLYCRAQHH